jgi:predicted DNA-binding transcriptional regulator YafY
MRPDPSPTARALLALELVQSQPGITADRIAERLGVTSRAARRYVAILREAGIPIVSVSGPAGGYRPGRGLRLPPLMFSADEALGLVMAVLDGHHDVADPTNPVGSALGKFLQALPESVAAQAEAVRRSTAPVPDRGAARPDPGTTATLVQACADCRRVRLAYRSEAATEMVLEVEPWAVVVRHSRWYLLCRSVRADAGRAYRVDRVHDVEVLHERFEPPADLDPVTALEEHLAAGWRHEAVVVIDAPLETVSRQMPRTLGRLEAAGHGTTRLTGTTSNPEWYAQQLAGIPVGYQVEGDDAIRTAVQSLGQRMLAARRLMAVAKR